MDAGAGGRGRVRELMLPPGRDALVCSPTWAEWSEGGGESWQPVSLVMALEGEPAVRHAEMVADHREVLAALTGAGEGLLAASDDDAPVRRDVGYNLVVFAAELASALRWLKGGGRVDDEGRRACAEAIASATLVAGGCLAATIVEHQTARAAQR